MNTIALIELIMTYPGHMEWMKVRGTKGRISSFHWFRPSGAGSKIILHKVEENGQSEALSQPVMSVHYKGFRWYLA